MKNKKTSQLAIVDWGIGGLGFYQKFKQRHPQTPLLYFSDAGFTPYGKVKTSVLIKRLESIFRFLKTQGATHVVIACHAASTAFSLDHLEDEFAGLKITNISAHSLRWLLSRPEKNIAIIGGRRTILSQALAKPCRKQDKMIQQRIAQKLSALIEAGELSGKNLEETLIKILKPLQKCDLLLLACTHYPAVMGEMQKILSQQQIIDPVNLLIDWVDESWPAFSVGPYERSFQQKIFTTGSVQNLKTSAKLAFAVELDSVKKVSLH